MGAFISIPDEVLITHVTKGLIGTWTEKKEELYAVRATCKNGLDLARLTIADKKVMRSLSCSFFAPPQRPWQPSTEPQEMRVSAQVVEAMGRVWGHGCTFLSSCGQSPARIAALEAFVSRSTPSCLTMLSLEDAAVSEEMLLRMCRKLPNLVRLNAPAFMETSDETIRAISVCCPEMKWASFSQLGRDSAAFSPAETWVLLFPKLVEFSLFGGKWVGYTPTKLSVIRETALNSQADEIDLYSCHITAEVIEAIVGTPLGDRIERLGDINRHEPQDTIIEPAAFLAAACGFPKLEDVYVPKGSSMGGPSFYIDLSRASSRIDYLDISDVDTTDACVAAACAHLRLVHLGLQGERRQGLEGLTLGVVESIMGGQAAKTLTHITIKYAAEDSLRAVDMCRLVTGCPKLEDFSWTIHDELHDLAELDEEPLRHIEELLESRGGSTVCYAIGEWEEDSHDPDCIFE